MRDGFEEEAPVGWAPPPLPPGPAHTRLPVDTLSVPIRDSRATPVLFRETVGGGVMGKWGGLGAGAPGRVVVHLPSRPREALPETRVT